MGPCYQARGSSGDPVELADRYNYFSGVPVIIEPVYAA